MKLHHRFTVPASIQDAWAAFNDLQQIGGCLPGATITSIDGDDFTGTVKVKLGPISLLYNGTGSYTERDEATRTVVIVAKGKDKRGNGTASATITAVFVADGPGTAVEVDTDLSITGKPAQFGRGVIQDVSDQLLGQFVECVKTALTPEDPTPAGPEAEAATTEPAAAEPPSADRTATAGTVSVAGRSTGALQTAPLTGTPAAEINLMSTVGPLLLKRFGKPLIAAVGVIGVWWLVRRFFGGAAS